MFLLQIHAVLLNDLFKESWTYLLFIYLSEHHKLYPLYSFCWLCFPDRERLSAKNSDSISKVQTTFNKDCGILFLYSSVSYSLSTMLMCIWLLLLSQFYSFFLSLSLSSCLFFIFEMELHALREKQLQGSWKVPNVQKVWGKCANTHWCTLFLCFQSTMSVCMDWIPVMKTLYASIRLADTVAPVNQGTLVTEPSAEVSANIWTLHYTLVLAQTLQ